MTVGKREAEKNTPERIHMGSMTRFIRPEAASMVRAREATSSPSAEKASEVSTHRNPSSHNDPLNGTPKATRAKPKKTPTSMTSMINRESRNEARYCQRGMGEATRRLRRFFCRASPIERSEE